MTTRIKPLSNRFIILDLLLEYIAVSIMAIECVTEFDKKLFEFIKQGDYEANPWSTPKAAEKLGVKEKDIYESLCRLQKLMKGKIYMYYRNGAIRIQAE